MKSAIYPALACLGVAAFGVGCSDSDSDPNPGNNNTPSNDVVIGNFNLTQTSATLAEAQCSFISRCRPSLLEFFSDDVADCRAQFAEELLIDFQFRGGAVEAGRIQFMPERVTACVTQLASASCAAQIPVDSPCNNFLQGTQAVGGACSLTSECNNSFCNLPNGPGSCGTCTAFAPAGATCGQVQCEPTSGCFNLTDGFTCAPIDGTEGGACGNPPLSGLCEGELSCAGQPGAFTCQAPGLAGAPCNNQTLDNPACSQDQGFTCGEANTCVAIQWAEVGQACGISTFCRSDAFCDQGTLTCVALPNTGAACTTFGACAPGNYCQVNGATAFCTALQGEGQPCQNGGECQQGLSCLGTVGQGMCQRFEYAACN